MSGLLKRTGGDTGRGKSGSHNFSISAPVLILNLMQVLILHVIPVKVLALAMKKHCNKQNTMLLVAITH